jgi:hypothetical protein
MKTRPIFLALVFVILMGLPQMVLAVDSYMATFNTLYKTGNTKLNSCKVCHTAKVPALNSYGKAFKLKHKGSVSPKAALKLIQKLDSDKDTFANLVEIKALTFPGNAKSKPPKSPAQSAPASTASSPSAAQSTFSSTGSTPDFILEPGHQFVQDVNEAGNNIHSTTTVLNETKVVDGVETRVVEERITENGDLVQIIRKYYAISDSNNSVFYFGRDVDNYAGGQIVNHDGSWLAGSDGAGAILMAKPQ